MIDQIGSAPKADHQDVTEDQSEIAVVNLSGREPEQPAAEDNGTAASKSVAITIARLSHVRSEEETAEESRRWKAIKSHRHPDTGERLRPGDEKALRPLERSWLKMHRATQIQMRTIDDAYAKYQMKADILERARTISHWGLNTPSWDSRPDSLSFQTDQITRSDVDRARERLERSQVSRTIMDADLAAVRRRRDCDQLAEAELRRRFLEPLFDSAFVNRITGYGNADLMARASERHEQVAVRALSDQVNTTAAALITELWRDPGRLYRGATAMGFQSDSLLMQTEAQRLLSIYGPRIVDQTGFLVEQHRNLGLFAPGLTATSFERSDLLARIALQPTFPIDLISYELADIEAVERYGHAALAQLETDFSMTKNPVLAWEAFVTARNYAVDVPDWVWDVVQSAADGITRLREDVENGTPLGKEAEVVGRALGFGKKGRGGTGWFAEATQVANHRMGRALPAVRGRYPRACSRTP